MVMFQKLSFHEKFKEKQLHDQSGGTFHDIQVMWYVVASLPTITILSSDSPLYTIRFTITFKTRYEYYGRYFRNLDVEDYMPISLDLDISLLRRGADGRPAVTA